MITQDGKRLAALTYDCWVEASISLDELQQLLPHAWKSLEFPGLLRFPLGYWIGMFETTGFITDVDGVEPPMGPITIYRGSTWGRRRSLSWTVEIDCARWFAQRWFDIGYVFRVEVSPEAVLAFFDGRKEREVVVNPTQLPPLGRSSITLTATQANTDGGWDRERHCAEPWPRA